MYDEWFKAVKLTVIELPIEVIENSLIYTAYIKEIPFISAEAGSLQEVYQKLAEQYAAYRRQHQLEAEEADQETKPALSVEELLKYYDGETMDGFSDYF